MGLLTLSLLAGIVRFGAHPEAKPHQVEQRETEHAVADEIIESGVVANRNDPPENPARPRWQRLHDISLRVDNRGSSRARCAYQPPPQLSRAQRERARARRHRIAVEPTVSAQADEETGAADDIVLKYSRTHRF